MEGFNERPYDSVKGEEVKNILKSHEQIVNERLMKAVISGKELILCKELFEGTCLAGVFDDKVWFVDGTDYARKKAMEIVDIFEDFLDEHNITIPSPEDDEREPDNSARLYGSVYWNLVEDVEESLRCNINE